MAIGTLGRKALLAASIGGVHRIARRSLLQDASSLSAGTAAIYVVVCIVLVIFSGICAGLTLGLLSLDRVDIEIYKRSGSQKEQWLAKRIEPVLSNPHYLLCTLLLCNAGCMEALPIFLDRLLNPVAAILISVTAILIFGEIIPQAVCKRYGLQVGAYLSWLVRLMMLVTAPITWPFGKLLDWLLGEETALFRRPELRALVTLHAETEEDGGEAMLTEEEVTVIHGALDMAHKTAETAMTPLEKVFSVPADAVLDRALIEMIIEVGHSRVPVYEGGDKKAMIGLLLVKELVLVDLAEGKKVRNCRMRDILHIRADTPLYAVMDFFRARQSHMAVLTRPVQAAEGSARAGGAFGAPLLEKKGPSAVSLAAAAAAEGEAAAAAMQVAAAKAAEEIDVIGIITIEDVIEELLQEEILDETDRYVDNLQTEEVMPTKMPDELRKWMSGKRRPRVAVARRSPAVVGQGAVVAAAAGAAYAAARSQRAGPVAVGGGGVHTAAAAPGQGVQPAS